MVDVCFVYADAVLAALAIAAAVWMLAIVAARVRVAGARTAATAITIFAVAQVVSLLAAGPMLWFSASDTLARFGAENMLPMIIAPAARFGAAILVAVLAADGCAIGASSALARVT